MILQQPFAIPNLPFSPTKIAGCQLWLKANIIAASNNDPISSWADSSGNGNTFSQATGGNQPLYKTSIINGLPTVLFDGTDDFMSHTGNLTTQPNTVFVVTQPTLSTASQKNYACFFHDGGQSFIVAKITTSFWGTFTTPTGDLSSTNALTSGSNYLLECTTTSTGGSVFLYQKGVQVATRAGAAVTGPGGTNVGLGKDLINSNRQYAGHIAEVIYYDTVLSSGNRALVENYLIAKYAL